MCPQPGRPRARPACPDAATGHNAGCCECDAGRVACRRRLPHWAGACIGFDLIKEERQVKDHGPPEVNVAMDSFVAARHDQILHARLHGSFALCLSDEVHEAGALVHVQAGRPGRVGTHPDLTDNTLSTDLLLLDRCLSQLRLAEPRARHWQARFVAHADPAAGGLDRLSALQAFIEVYLEDTDVALTSAVTHEGAPRLLSFRPALRSLRCEEAFLPDETCRMQVVPE